MRLIVEFAAVDRRQAVLSILGLAGLAGGLVSRALAQGRRDVELLMFDDTGCPYCRQWHREVGQAYRNSPEGRRAPLRVVMLRGPRPEGITLKSAVRATPTFVLVQDGREVGRLTGYGGPDFFWSTLAVEMKKLQKGEGA